MSNIRFDALKTAWAHQPQKVVATQRGSVIFSQNGGQRGPVPGPADPPQRRAGHGLGQHSLRPVGLRHGPREPRHQAPAGRAGGPGKIPPEPVEDHQ